MSFCPAQMTFPPAQFADTADSDLELPSCHRANTSTSLPSTTPLLTPTPVTTSSLLPSSSPPLLTDTEDGFDSVCHPSKHTSDNMVKSTLSNESVVTSTSTSGNTNTDAPNTTWNPKKARTSVSSGHQLVGEDSEISVINIEDINDLDNEWLNKLEPTADIKHFLKLSLASQVKPNHAWSVTFACKSSQFFF